MISQTATCLFIMLSKGGNGTQPRSERRRFLHTPTVISPIIGTLGQDIKQAAGGTPTAAGETPALPKKGMRVCRLGFASNILCLMPGAGSLDKKVCI